MDPNKYLKIEPGTEKKDFVKYNKLNKKGKTIFKLLHKKLKSLNKNKKINRRIDRKKVRVRAFRNIHSISYHINSKRRRFCDLHLALVPEFLTIQLFLKNKIQLKRRINRKNHLTLHLQTFGNKLKGKKKFILGYSQKRRKLKSYAVVSLSSKDEINEIMKIVEQSFIRRLKRSKLWKLKKTHKRT